MRNGRLVAIIGILLLALGVVWTISERFAELPGDSFGTGAPAESSRDEAATRLRALSIPNGAAHADEIENVSLDGGTVSGTVIERTSQEPVGGVTVRLLSELERDRFETTSNADGAFVIAAVPPGVYEIETEGDHLVPADTHLEASVRGSSVTELRVFVQRFASLSGRVIDAATGAPVERFAVIALHGGPVTPGATFSGSDGAMVSHTGGEFRIDDVRPGDTTVRAIAEGFVEGYAFIREVSPGELVTGVEVALKAAASIDGLVTDADGVPILGAHVFSGGVPSEAHWATSTMAVTSSAGEFHVAPNNLGVRELFAVRKGYRPGSAPVLLEPGASAQVHIVLMRGATLEGQVRVGGLGAGAAIDVWSGSRGDIVSVETDEDGFYTLPAVATGSVNVRVMTRAEQRTRETVVVTAEDAVTAVDFDFEAADAALEGVVTLGGVPVPSAIVQLVYSASGDSERHSVGSGEDGAYRFEHVPAGEARLQVHGQLLVEDDDSSEEPRRSREVFVDLVSGGVTRMDVELFGGETISGRVSGIPEGYVFSIYLMTMEAAGVSLEPLLSPQTLLLNRCCSVAPGYSHRDGSFSFSNVDHGAYVIYVIARDLEPPSGNITEGTIRVEREVEVGEQGLTEIDIPLTPRRNKVGSNR